MVRARQRKFAKVLIERYGRTYAEQAGIRLKNTPAPLFQLLNAALLLSARIPADNAVRAARALIDAGLTTPRSMAEASWQDRVDVITWHGYKRYDERTATMLGQTAEHLIEHYSGDLRKLRKQADRDVAALQRLLQQFKGIGKVGADIFLREAQNVWEEVYPYADERVSEAARHLGLADTVQGLAGLVARPDFPRLVAGLVRVDLAGEHDALMDAVRA
jgi:endonuclease III